MRETEYKEGDVLIYQNESIRHNKPSFEVISVTEDGKEVQCWARLPGQTKFMSRQTVTYLKQHYVHDDN